MRYIKIDTISFTDIDGKQYPIKDIRPIPVYTTLLEIDVREIDRVDEIASREIVYGAGGEDQSFKIFDHNIILFMEAGFDMSKIKTLKIPI